MDHGPFNRDGSWYCVVEDVELGPYATRSGCLVAYAKAHRNADKRLQLGKTYQEVIRRGNDGSKEQGC